ncbi:MAG: hypothetical protein KDA22_06700 [Phycisphaerales bacterium]|nr:hypothetical protein [Phycisphaerales bacterium]
MDRNIFGLSGVAAMAMLALTSGLAHGQCPIVCTDAIEQGDGCGDDPDSVNGGCNFSETDPAYDNLGAFAGTGGTINYHGTVGTFGANTRDLDWAVVSVPQGGYINVSATHCDPATDMPAPNFTMFVIQGSDCATQETLFAAASGASPFVSGDLFVSAGNIVLIFTVNAFAPDLPACPVEYCATITFTPGDFPECGDPLAGPCDEAHAGGGCDVFACCENVCAFNPDCCMVEWDDFCVELALDPSFGCGIFNYVCEAPVVDNDCAAGATEVFVDDVVDFDTTGANTDGPPQDECGSGPGNEQLDHDVWYWWQSTAAGVFTASTCNLTQFDTKVAMYDLGTETPDTFDPETLPSLFMGCNEDCGDEFFASELSLNVEAGHNYLIRLGGFAGSEGPGQIAFSAALFPPPDECTNGGDDIITQSNDPVADAGQIACAGGGITTANSFARSFIVPGEPKDSYTLNCADFGFSNSGSDLLGAINVYEDTDGGEPLAPGNDLVLLGSRAVTLSGGGFLGNLIAAFDPPITVAGGTALVVELDIPASTDGFAVCGGNGAGETGPTYILATACGIANYVTYASINFPDANWALTLLGVLNGGGCPTCPDFDNSGTVDGADLGLLLGAWGPAVPGECFDINGSGDVDGADLGLLLGAWGPCL